MSATGLPNLPAGTDVYVLAEALLAAAGGAYGGAEGRGGLFKCPVHGDGERLNLNLAVGETAPYIMACQVCIDEYEPAAFRDAVLAGLARLGHPVALEGVRPGPAETVDWGPRSRSASGSRSPGSRADEERWRSIPDSDKSDPTFYAYPERDGSPKAMVVRQEAVDSETGKRIKRIRPWHYNDDAEPSRANAETRAWQEQLPRAWKWRLGWGDSPRTPYGWDQYEFWQGEVLALTEGEKDADTLRATGRYATTYPFGTFPDAATLREHLGDLKFAVVYGDFDRTGYFKAAKLVQLLKEAGYKVRTRFVDPESLRAAGVDPEKADVTDWVNAGFDIRQMVPMKSVRAELVAEESPHSANITINDVAAPPGVRRVRAVSLTDVEPAPVIWLWNDLIPAGELTLLAGRQGIGKSTLGYQLAADVTNGKLEGEYFGSPQDVLIIATEDSLEHTIVPRLIAAGADLARVHVVEVERADGMTGPIDFARDLPGLGEMIASYGARLVLIDPLMSRLGGKVDTHKDSEVRDVLEPLVRLAHEHGAALVALIHVNKSGAPDPLNLVMGSVAFTAVARSVLFLSVDPEDEGRRLLGQVKSNLGRLMNGSLRLSIASVEVGGAAGSRIASSRVVWGAADPRTIADVIDAQRKLTAGKTVAEKAADFISNYLRSRPGLSASRKEVLIAAESEWSTDQINKGCRHLKENGRIKTERKAKQGGDAIWTLLGAMDSIELVGGEGVDELAY